MAEIGQLLEKAVPENTRKSTLMWVTTFDAFCREQGLVIDLATCSATELNDALCKFYPALRTKKGEMYKKASYFAARAAIHRRTRELDRPFNIFKSDCFSRSHAVLDATLKVKKVEGLEPAVRHKEAISDADRELLEHYFDDVLVANDPVKLTMYVWFETTLHFGLCGREV